VKEGNGNASGYLVCYTDIPRDGDRAFESRKLRLTSLHVREKIREYLNLVSEIEKAKKVLEALSGTVTEKVDLGGAYLEATVATMIAAGRSNNMKWQIREVGTAKWKEYKPIKRTVELVGVDNMANSLSKQKRLFLSSKRSFPVVDIVESQPKAGAPVTTYQTTWRVSHPTTMGALRKLRQTELEIGSKRLLKIVFVVPENEETYAKREKTEYLKEDEKGLSADETKMWNNTSIYVLRLKDGWQKAIETFFFTKGQTSQKETMERGETTENDPNRQNGQKQRNNRKQPKTAKQRKTAKQSKTVKQTKTAKRPKTKNNNT
jgi:hypothetical protein